MQVLDRTLNATDSTPSLDSYCNGSSHGARTNFDNDIMLSRTFDKKGHVKASPRSVRMVSLVIGDVTAFIVCTLLAFLLASLVNFNSVQHNKFIGTDRVVFATALFVVALSAQVWLSWSWGHYTRFSPAWIELKQTIMMSLCVGAIVVAVIFVFKQPFSRMWIGLSVVLLCIVVPATRILVKRQLVNFGWWFKSTFVVGTGDNAKATACALDSDLAMGHRVDGFIDLTATVDGKMILGKPILSKFPTQSSGKLNELPCIIFAFDSLSEMNDHRSVVSQYLAMSPVATVSPPINGIPFYGAEVISVLSRDSVLLKLRNNLQNKNSILIKRLFDISICSLVIIAFSPVMLILAIIVSYDGGHCIYGHERLGKNGLPFKCWKFRSMVTNSEEILESFLANNESARIEWKTSHKLKVDPRVTTVGKFIRATSLDELPQLFNVLRGEMSLVGPRPIVNEEALYYGEYLPYYLSTMPGITGLWQTSGRSDTTYNERVMLDGWYSRNWSVWLDIVLLLRTVRSLITREGAR